MIKNVIIKCATTTVLLLSGFTSAHATPVPYPVQAGDGFYTTSVATSSESHMTVAMPARLCTFTAIPQHGVAISASHCFIRIGQPVWSRNGNRVGTCVDKDDSHDIAFIRLNDNITHIVSHIEPMDVHIGDRMSKKGARSHVTHGHITSGLTTATVIGSKDVFISVVNVPYRMTIHDVYDTNICAQPGDSGSPVYHNGVIVGLLSSSDSAICDENSHTSVVDLDRAIYSYSASRQM